MSEGLLLVLLVGFAYRVTRLVTTDDITATLRDRLTWKRVTVPMDGYLLCGEHVSEVSKSVPRKYLHTLLTCNWCSGAWVSLATVLAYHFAVEELPPPWLWVGAVATGVGIVSKLVND